MGPDFSISVTYEYFLQHETVNYEVSNSVGLNIIMAIHDFNKSQKW